MLDSILAFADAWLLPIIGVYMGIVVLLCGFFIVRAYVYGWDFTEYVYYMMVSSVPPVFCGVFYVFLKEWVHA